MSHQLGWRPAPAVLIFFAGALAAVTPEYVRRYQIPVNAAIGIYACFVLSVALIVIPTLKELRNWRPKPILLPVAWCIPYLVYALGTGHFAWTALARLVLIALPMVLVYEFAPIADLRRLRWQDGVAAVWLIAVVLSNQLKGIWTVPVNLDFMGRLYVISVAAWTWTFIRPVPELGFEFYFTLTALGASAKNFCWFASIAIPLGLVLGFTSWNPRWHGLGQFCTDYLGIFLFIALLEEMFFRGFLQTLLAQSLKSANKSQAFVACLFGLFHILHAPFPNWRYVVLASIAGWFYGSAFRQGGNLMASATMHALVDTVWRTFLTKG